MSGIAGSPGFVTLYDQAVVGMASLDFANLAPFKTLRLSFDITSVGAALGFNVRTSTDNGSTFLAGATDYNWYYIGASAASSAGDTKINAGDLTLATARKGIIEIKNLNDANMPTSFDFNTLHSNPFLYAGFGGRTAATAENALRLLTSASTVTGRIKLEGSY